MSHSLWRKWEEFEYRINLRRATYGAYSERLQINFMYLNAFFFSFFMAVSATFSQIHHSIIQIVYSSLVQEVVCVIFVLVYIIMGTRGSVVLKALYYKEEGSGFETR
jgi:threonine/homoserine/homoserine lactone efflux protein